MCDCDVGMYWAQQQVLDRDHSSTWHEGLPPEPNHDSVLTFTRLIVVDVFGVGYICVCFRVLTAVRRTP